MENMQYFDKKVWTVSILCVMKYFVWFKPKPQIFQYVNSFELILIFTKMPDAHFYQW